MMTDILNKFKQLNLELKIPIMRDENLVNLVNQLSRLKISQLLEIGTGIGFSSMYLSVHLPDLVIDTLEKDIQRYQIAKEWLVNFSKINCLLGDCYEFMPSKKYQAIILDGPKAKQIELFNKYLNYLLPCGVMIIDNFFLKNIKPNNKLYHKNLAWQEFIHNLDKKQFNVEIDQSGDGVVYVFSKPSTIA
ncbi:SAM-dependent methyltransferase [Mycoplasmoides gallisepticum]|nr:SAM-dependent methyltransferase [Mycoplasmoides gallisepticum]ULH62388.1 SAM-dependent methyltransferase [Mycoplasmoides gallisepticum]ULH67727.1 SAM-dependent methyltransferase [Mycoplasmoides gallisepticum]ULH68454.1 SAM-dependent methyltransferase [Mycoplasmoides gallisepticum]WGG24099.1 SAM-dependent methyltransferase [Mycoplasmoides gallisepticum]WGG24857.1 SAM-dependent methyltransferase [Mycoplasmoides gallisepticum]